MTEMYISLTDEKGNELPYHIDQIFSVEGTQQLYCAAVYYGSDDVENEVVMLRCDLTSSGTEAEVSISDIPDADEYAFVAAAYQAQTQDIAIKKVFEELAEAEDFGSLVDTDGKVRNFIFHLIFKNEKTGREYVAAQEVNEMGQINEEVTIFRFREGKEASHIDMIPSDMEYQEARELLIRRIEADASTLLQAGLLPS